MSTEVMSLLDEKAVEILPDSEDPDTNEDEGGN